MLNNPNAKSEDYTVQKGVVRYPVGFLFQFNGDNTPQVKVKIGDVVPRLNVDYEFSDDYSTLILIPTEEETKAPGFNYDDYLWMDKWIGMPLVIERDIPFVQESDYQLGRISPERIEKDFDLSVMRDQELRNQADKDREAANEQVEQLRKDMDDEFAAVDSRFDFVQEQTDAKFAEVDSRIDDVQEQTDAKFAETDIAISGLAVGVAANESAIQETRDDFASADQAIREDFASADQAIRDDMNAKDSRLQTQITAQAAEIATKQDQLIAGDNITIVDNVISATGGGGGGGGIANVIHDATLTGSGTSASPLGLAETIKDEIADKAPKETVEALTQAVNLNIGEIVNVDNKLSQLESDLAESIDTKELTVSTDEGTLNLSITAGVATIATNNGLDIASQTKFDTAPTTDDNTTWANASEVSLVRKAQVATAIADAVANIDALPDQSGNAGKVLTTDGSTASWQEPQGGGTKIIIKRYN